MPWAPEYRKQGVRGITANAIDVVVEAGESAPMTPVGINLPNDQSIRETHGSKSVSLSNVNEAYERSTLAEFRREFAWTPEEAARAEKWSSVAGELTTDLHEVIGHALGQGRRAAERRAAECAEGAVLRARGSARRPGRALLRRRPQDRRARASSRPQDHDEIVLAEYEGYARNALVQLRRVREGTQIEEDHMRNRQMIVRWLMANSSAIEVRRREGKTYYVMTDPVAFREGVGRLLAEVQHIKAQGDYEAARTLFETHGVHFEPGAARRDRRARRSPATCRPTQGSSSRGSKRSSDGDGTITDVRISYPLDLTTQMLEYSGRR